MRRPRSYLVGIVALGLAATLTGCGEEDDAALATASPTAAPAEAPTAAPPGSPTAPPAATSPAPPTGTGTSDPQIGPARTVVDAFYAAVGRRDCFTMRTLAAPSYQQDDGYWADGCIDELQATVGDTYSFTVQDGLIDGQEAVFHVQRTLPDSSSVVDEVVLIAVSGWVVESRRILDG